MINSRDWIKLANAWRTKAHQTKSPIEAATLEKCADQLVALLYVDVVEVKSYPVKQAEAS